MSLPGKRDCWFDHGTTMYSFRAKKSAVSKSFSSSRKLRRCHRGLIIVSSFLVQQLSNLKTSMGFFWRMYSKETSCQPSDLYYLMNNIIQDSKLTRDQAADNSDFSSQHIEVGCCHLAVKLHTPAAFSVSTYNSALVFQLSSWQWLKT